MHFAHGLMLKRIQDFDLRKPNRNSHTMTSSEIFKKKGFLWDKEWTIRSSELGSGLAHNQGFAKEKGLELLVQKFYKYIEIGRREQISATQTYHRRELRLWGLWQFLQKIAILMPFGSHFACFQSYLNKQKFLRFESQLKKFLHFLHVKSKTQL